MSEEIDVIDLLMASLKGAAYSKPGKHSVGILSFCVTETTVRRAASEITRLRGEVEDVRDELADAWPEDREAVLAGNPADYIAKLISERDDEILEAERLRGEVERLSAENTDLKQSVIAFCAPWAVTYARDGGLPAGHLHPGHYDTLEKCGARMDDFTRAPKPEAAG